MQVPTTLTASRGATSPTWIRRSADGCPATPKSHWILSIPTRSNSLVRVGRNRSRKKLKRNSGSNYTDRESRSDVAHVDPSLRRRMSAAPQSHWIPSTPTRSNSIVRVGRNRRRKKLKRNSGSDYTDRESRSDVAHGIRRSADGCPLRRSRTGS